MIPVSTLEKPTDNLPGIHEVEFSIDPEDMKWMMRLASDNYADTETAVVREYATNAWDAHVEAGHDDPIEVFLPSSFNNHIYRVVDHGVGMSLDTMLKVYTKFGKSTGRNSNDRNGMLGIGSKSAVAYTSAFTVVSVKDGERVEAIISKDDDWTIRMKVVSVTPTTERNGTEIIIPVSNAESFRHKAMEFFKFWNGSQGKVLIDGHAPSNEDIGEQITDNFYACYAWNRSYVVMANVPYEIRNPAALFRDSRISQINFVAYVDGGDVEFSNSREDLAYTERTKKALHKIISDFADQIVAEAEADLATAKTHAEAYQIWKKWGDRAGSALFTDLEFKGDKFANTFAIDAKRYQIGASRYGTWTINNWEVRSMDNTLIIVDFSKDLTSSDKQKAREYLQIKGISADYVLFTAHSKVSSPWVDQSRVIDWESVKDAIPKKPRKAAGGVVGGRLPGSWDYWMTKEWKSEQPLPTKGDVFYIGLQISKNYSVSHIMKAIGLDDNAAVIVVPANRMAKFKRENPNIKEFIEYAKTKVVKDGTKLLTKEAKRYLSLNYDYREALKVLDVSKINDPRFAADFKLLGDGDKMLKEYQDNLNLANWLRLGYNVVKQYEKEDLTNPLNDYPMLPHRFQLKTHRNHAVLYINAVYNSKKGKK